MCMVVSNGHVDELLGDIVIVPGTWTTFVLGEFLCLDNGYLWTVFFDRFPLPLGMNITPMTSDVFVQ